MQIHNTYIFIGDITKPLFEYQLPEWALPEVYDYMAEVTCVLLGQVATYRHLHVPMLYDVISCDVVAKYSFRVPDEYVIDKSVAFNTAKQMLEEHSRPYWVLDMKADIIHDLLPPPKCMEVIADAIATRASKYGVFTKLEVSNRLSYVTAISVKD